jgi:hypothetical protein
MCPVTTCPAGRTTCPSSKFPCDADLLHDNQNCGGCGVRCVGLGASQWSCVAGQCVLSCDSVSGAMNCDGDATNGCEVQSYDDINNCGDCGVKCPAGETCEKGRCTDGCLAANRPDVCNGACTNLKLDDYNCGTCGNVCDPTGPNLPAYPGTYYGCAGGVCGQRKCSTPNTADCNGDVADGCEATIHTNEHCGGCFDACPARKACGSVSGGSVFACLCEDDRETFCPYSGTCVSLDDDPYNCGGCGRLCPGVSLLRQHFMVTCTLGVCGGKCADGHADCDGLPDNGCEVDTSVDNRNCGACGNACLPDQPCSEGKCLVAPCSEGPTK